MYQEIYKAIIPIPPMKEATKTNSMFKTAISTPGIWTGKAALEDLELPDPLELPLPPEVVVPDGPPAELILLWQEELREDGVTT